MLTHRQGGGGAAPRPRGRPGRRSSIELTGPGPVDPPKALLRPVDALVFVSALTPDKGRDIRTLMGNLAMGEHVAAALASRPCAHVVYIGFDARYAGEPNPVSEA